MKAIYIVAAVIGGVVLYKAMTPQPAQTSTVGAVAGAFGKLADAAKSIWGSSDSSSTTTSSSSGSWFTDSNGESWFDPARFS